MQISLYIMHKNTNFLKTTKIIIQNGNQFSGKLYQNMFNNTANNLSKSYDVKKNKTSWPPTETSDYSSPTPLKPSCGVCVLPSGWMPSGVRPSQERKLSPSHHCCHCCRPNYCSVWWHYNKHCQNIYIYIFIMTFFLFLANLAKLIFTRLYMCFLKYDTHL